MTERSALSGWKGDCPKCFQPSDRISKHFRFREFFRPGDPWPPELYDRLLRLVYGPMEAVRTDLGYPVLILSGYRSPRHNASTSGAAPHSQHCAGRACDFRIDARGATDDRANDLTLDAHNYLLRHEDRLGLGGLGWYYATDAQPRARVHVDLRYRPPGEPLARWEKPAG